MPQTANTSSGTNIVTISTDQLSKVLRELGAGNSLPGDRRLAQINGYLGEIYQSPEYTDWIGREELQPASQFTIPPRLSIHNKVAHNLLIELEIAHSDSTLSARIDRTQSTIYLTDGFWVDPEYRVFPTSDESDILCDYVSRHSLASKYPLMIDPACGPGRHGIGIDTPYQISLDMSERALAYSRLNALLRGTTNQLFGANDIVRGFPKPINVLLREKTLIVANMPFAILPKRPGRPEPLAQDGGPRGVALSKALLDATAMLFKNAAAMRELRVILLFYSLGRSDFGPWEIAQYAEALFPDAVAKTTILTEKPMWRVNGRKEQPNPMPVSSLKEKARCRLTYKEFDEDAIRDGFLKRQQQFAKDGWTHLGYGVLDISLTKS